MSTERLQRLYSIAKEQGVVRSKREFADAIGASYTTFVRTLNGEKNYSPARFVLAGEDMLRAHGIDPNAEIVTLSAVMDEVKQLRKLVEKLLKTTEKGHI